MSKVEFKKGLMKKTIPVLCLLVTGFYVFAEKPKKTLITNIWLVNSNIYSSFTIPAVVPIGVNIIRDAYYKITDSRGTIVKGGLLKKGSNTIEINAENLFKESRAHNYILSLKVADRVLKKKIKIDVKLDSSASTERKVAGEKGNTTNIKGEPANKTGDPGYSLSMFIENRLIIKEKKPYLEESRLKTRELLKRDFGQPSHIDGSYPTLSGGGIPVLPLAVMLLTKVFFKKPKKAKKSLPTPRHLAIKFLRNEPGGKEKVVTAKIGITISPFN